MISWVLYVAVGLVVGGAAGFVIGKLDDFSKKEKLAMQGKLDQAAQELIQYKHDVTEHFIETAGLVNNMTQSYQAVHEHLARGAQTLSDHKITVDRLTVMKPAAIEARPVPAEDLREESQAAAASPAMPADAAVTTLVDSPDEMSQAVVASTTVESSASETLLPDVQAAEESVAEIAPDVQTAELQTAIDETVSVSAQVESETAESGPETAQAEIPADNVAVTAKGKKGEESALTDENAITMASRMVH